MGVTRSPLALAALATAAIPGLNVVRVWPTSTPGSDFDTAGLEDDEGGQWVIRAPARRAAGPALEAEIALLANLSRLTGNHALPFATPRVKGFAALSEGGRAAVHPMLSGTPLELERLHYQPDLAASLGTALAALHSVPIHFAEDAGLPSYNAETYRRRRLTEIDEAAQSGKVPRDLLVRWEHSLENLSWWRFTPVITHGDLTGDHVLVNGSSVAGVLGWGETTVADPADDFAWLFVAAPEEALPIVLRAYTDARSGFNDPHLADRAMLASELALARWLLHGMHVESDEVIYDAVSMLEELDQVLKDHQATQEAAQLAAEEVARQREEEKRLKKHADEWADSQRAQTYEAAAKRQAHMVEAARAKAQSDAADERVTQQMRGAGRSRSR